MSSGPYGLDNVQKIERASRQPVEPGDLDACTVDEAKALQRPVPDDAIRIVAPAC